MFFNQTASIRSLLILLLAITAFTFESQGFQQPLKTSDLYKRIITTEEESIYLENIRLVDDISADMYDKGVDFFEALTLKLGSEVDYDSTGIKSNVRMLDIYKVYGNIPSLEYLNIDTINIVKGTLNALTINKFRTKVMRIDSLTISDRLLIQDSKIGTYGSYKNTMDYFESIGNDFEGFFETQRDLITSDYSIIECLFKEGASFNADVKGNFISVRLEACDFEPIDSNLSFPLDSAFGKSDTLIMKTQASFSFFGKVDQAEIIENIFLADTVNNVDQYFSIQGDFDYMVVSANEIGVTMHPTATVSKQFIMDENNFTADFIFADFILEGRNNVLRWSEIAGFKLGSHVQFGSYVSEEPELFGYTQADAQQILNQTGGYLQRTYKASTDIELDDVEPFQRLLSSYYRLYKAFKENGDLDQANEVYVEMKDVQLKELSYQYHTYGGLENWIEWRLNYILRVYTDYGTKPAKAIKLSVWVVIFFSVFYFFFPSEWDTKSKGQLIEDYKLFIEKNDHGYFKPFTKLSLGFVKSLLNAFTLSLNSFVTLGFGTIPTTGLARYVCILQGFLGWFLLSIFTASLINQVLF